MKNQIDIAHFRYGTDTVWVLGAADPEMEAIEVLLRAFGKTVAHATDSTGRPVSASTAYSAVTPTATRSDRWVECSPIGGRSDIDHHRAGDVGFGRPPAEYWEASSIGQVCAALDVRPTWSRRIIAAADHCLAHAYRGLCPEVDPKALRSWRTASRAAFQNLPEAEIACRVEVALRILDSAPRLLFNGEPVADLLAYAPVAELPEAAAIRGLATMYTMPDARTGRTKVGLLAGSEAVCRAWLREWAPTHHVVDTYGDPMRGIVGGYQR